MLALSQANEHIFGIIKGRTGIEFGGKALETSLDTGSTTACPCAITLLHEQWMCIGIQRYIHITGNKTILYNTHLCVHATWFIS